MITFTDYYNNQVQLSFENHPFSKEPKHVWVVCRWNDQWLLTKHKDRGIEFPGGKVEEGENPEEAAIREVNEETGGIIDNLIYIGQYYVEGKGGNIIKNIYYATIEKVIRKDTYYETEGPVFLEKLPINIKSNPDFSFMMKDEILPNSLGKIFELSQF
ncbi:RNA deprotection pyrophosphohydrolase [Sediminibacillus massiliensis]|uniref:RNA deprotection pyrophosphohydrolase n=1 Tax=Sediminibacillus massiliensis TaxID=1926277 RepID=UPI0009883FA6|nr:nucleoside triphosphatase YtkD [Sediminibacillus massiliensis]